MCSVDGSKSLFFFNLVISSENSKTAGWVSVYLYPDNVLNIVVKLPRVYWLCNHRGLH